MTKESSILGVANLFGALGYLSILIQLAWSLIIFLYPFLLQGDIMPMYTEPNVSPSPLVEEAFSPVVLVITIAITIAVLFATTIVVVRLPKAIGKTGSHFTHRTAHVLAPVLAKKPLTKKRYSKLSAKLVAVLKLLLIIIPPLSLFFAPSIDILPRQAMIVFALFWAGCSLVCFLIQYSLAILNRLPYSRIL
ncbi:hypothetical protein EOL96_01870 [Candidatus Saccharibacteria bacterium]|nr:hypothetical protein [Candidatus Saccharibacteria bacterium]